jgi:hypothetical protein
MKVLLINLVFLILVNPLQAQQREVPLGLSNSAISNSNFFIYSPRLIVKPTLKDSTEAANEYPEQLVTSILSSSNQTWVNYNTLGGAKNSEKLNAEVLQFRKSMDKDKNFQQLVCKFSFTANGSEMAMIKFFFHTEKLPKAYSGVTVMQKVGNRWYQTSPVFTSQLSLLMMRFDSEKLATVMKAKPTGDKLMDNLIKQVKDENGINLDKLTKEFNQWYSTNDKEKLDYFIDKDAW